MSKLLVFNERWCAGGVEALWANVLSNVSASDFEIVIVVWRKETNLYDNLLAKKNVRLIEIGDKLIENPVKRDIAILRLLKNSIKREKPDIVHINVCNAIGLKYAQIARRAGCKHIIVHSHNTMIEHDKFKIKLVMHYLMRHFYGKQPIYRMACSTEAGEFMFGKDRSFEILKNGVDVPRFTFNEQIRKSMRKKYCLHEDDFVVCHVGRFARQKNHEFLIRLFAEINRQHANSYLFLAGEGPEFERIKSLVHDTKLEKYVYFLGTISEIQDLYFMSDVFVLPSLHEGLPIVAVEAQTTGLNCYLADTISREACITRACKFFSLSESYHIIAQKILNSAPLENRKDVLGEIINEGYSIVDSSNKLFDFYRSLVD